MPSYAQGMPRRSAITSEMMARSSLMNGLRIEVPRSFRAARLRSLKETPTRLRRRCFRFLPAFFESLAVQASTDSLQVSEQS